MRILLVTALCAVGCLHAQGPVTSAAKADPETIHAFDIMINDADTIADAAVFARAQGLRREDWIGSADRAYQGFMRAGVYVSAAEIAWRFHFGAHGIGMPLEFQRDEVRKAVGAYATGRGESAHGSLYAAIWEMTLEMRIACRYGPTAEAAKETVRRAVDLRSLSGEYDVLYPLLDEGCPVGPELRADIIDAAVNTLRLDDYAIRHAAASDWNGERRYFFLWRFFGFNRCSAGFRAATAIRMPPDEVVMLVESSHCDYETLTSDGWNLRADDAGRYFFAAVRKQGYNLALELLKPSGFGEDGEVFLFQEALRSGYDSQLVGALRRHMTHHEALMAYAWEHGRYRFIANLSLTLDWRRKAFDKLIELGQWAFAAEAAQYGPDGSFRTEGVLIALRAAMAAGDFKAGRYFLARYGPTKTKAGLVTRAMYDEARKKYYHAKAKRKRPKRPPCPRDDWSVGPCG